MLASKKIIVFFSISVIMIHMQITSAYPVVPGDSDTNELNKDLDKALSIDGHVSKDETDNVSKESEYGEDSMIMPFIKMGINELTNDPNLLNKAKVFVQSLIKEYPANEHPESILPVLLSAAKTMLDGGYVDPNTIINYSKKIMKKVNQEPDYAINNIRKIKNKVVIAAGDGIKHAGNIGAGMVRVVKDLHYTQAPITNAVSSYIPIIGSIVSGFNSLIGGSLTTLQIAAKYGTASTSNVIQDYAKKSKEEMKKSKSSSYPVSQEKSNYSASGKNIENLTTNKKDTDSWLNSLFQ